MIVAEGLVFGHAWGGGGIVYRAVPLKGESVDEIVEKIRNSNDLGEFDSGMGYEKVLGLMYSTQEIVDEDGWRKSRYLEDIIEDRGMTDEEWEFFDTTFISSQLGG